MTERIVDIPRESTWETPGGWYVIEFYRTPQLLGSNRPTSARITDDPMHPELMQVLKGDTEDYTKQTVDYLNRMAEAISIGSEPIANRELHPDYYQTVSGIQAWDVIKAFSLDYWKGTVLAYICRAGLKGDEYEDLRKAWTVLGERLSELEKEAHPLHVVTIQDTEDEPKPHGPTPLG